MIIGKVIAISGKECTIEIGKIRIIMTLTCECKVKEGDSVTIGR